MRKHHQFSAPGRTEIGGATIQITSTAAFSQPKTRLYQVTFTQPGSFPKLQEALGYEADHVWTEGDRFSFMFNWYGIERAFQQAFGSYMKITAADALLVLLEDYPYSQVRKTPSRILERLFQAAWKKLYVIHDPNACFELTEEIRKVS